MPSTDFVTPREGRVSRNDPDMFETLVKAVTPREGRVSRNYSDGAGTEENPCHIPRETCE